MNEKIIPVEVKTETKLRKGFISFLNTYKPARALVLTEQEFRTEKIGQTTVAFIPYFFI